MKTPNLDRLHDLLQQMNASDDVPYRVPGRWLGRDGEVVVGSGTEFLLGQIHAIRSLPSVRPARPLVYNALLRHVTSFDHSDESRGCGGSDRWRSTGTFTKFLALIPHLRSMGVTQVVLLPVFARGSIGRKGSIGSPYAVRNPFALDDDLAEPCLAMTTEQQAKAMIEALHLAGISVVFEVVLRTASLDSDLVSHAPHWFYWVKQHVLANASLRAPAFSAPVLEEIHARINSGDRVRLPEPDPEYRSMFSQPPAEVLLDHQGWSGVDADGYVVRLPGAFADWPPDDPQPAWSDVTYLRLHQHADFLYPAYNTLRMFDERLEHEECMQRDLWNLLSQIIPHYQRTLGIDGAMIDMGHALPLALRHEILQRAREHCPGFTIYEECFELDSKLAEQGVDAVIGYLPHVSRSSQGLAEFAQRCSTHDVTISYFGAVDSHNTPRIASTYTDSASFAAWWFLSLLPKALPYVVAGFELGETCPINTGLDFQAEEMEYFRQHGLPLFDDVPLPWMASSSVLARLQHRLRWESSWQIISLLQHDDDVVMLDGLPVGVIGYVRRPQRSRRAILVCLNHSTDDEEVSISRSIVVDAAVVAGVVVKPDEIRVSVSAESCCVLPVLLRTSRNRPSDVDRGLSEAP